MGKIVSFQTSTEWVFAD